jgi:KRAB domain-containing zinc finger protein
MSKLFKCDMKGCDKTFSTKFSLRRHILRHVNNKKFVCAHCRKAFVLAQYLEEHEFTHTGVKPFVCGIDGCLEAFRQRGKLSLHKKMAHN